MIDWASKVYELWKIQDLDEVYFEYQLHDYEILQRLFKSIKTVKCIGGCINLDFFIAQSNNQVKSCVNIDCLEDWAKDGKPNEDIDRKHQRFKKMFDYNGEYKLIKEKYDGEVFNEYYDCIIDSLGTGWNDHDSNGVNVTWNGNVLPKLYVGVHRINLERRVTNIGNQRDWKWLSDVDKKLSMLLCTKRIAIFGDFKIPELEYFGEITEKFTMKVNDRFVPMYIAKDDFLTKILSDNVEYAKLV